MSLLKTVREQLGWTQLRMAQALDCTTPYVSLVETGRSKLSRRLHAKLHIIATAQGVMIDAGMPQVRPADRQEIAAELVKQLADLRAQLEHAQIELDILNGRLRLQQRELDNYKQKD